jgi:hypothetical protein
MPAKSIEIREGFEPVAEAFARAPDVEVAGGWGAGNLTWKVGGKIFVMSVRGDLVAKLPRERVDAMVADDAGVRFDPRKNGRVMKEWIVVPPGGPWVTLAREALAFVRGEGAKARTGSRPAPRRSCRCCDQRGTV